jgi:hypothetical protein
MRLRSGLFINRFGGRAWRASMIMGLGIRKGAVPIGALGPTVRFVRNQAAMAGANRLWEVL